MFVSTIFYVAFSKRYVKNKQSLVINHPNSNHGNHHCHHHCHHNNWHNIHSADRCQGRGKGWSTSHRIAILTSWLDRYRHHHHHHHHHHQHHLHNYPHHDDKPRAPWAWRFWTSCPMLRWFFSVSKGCNVFWICMLTNTDAKIENQWKYQVIVVSVGGGGLMAGIAAYAKTGH